MKHICPSRKKEFERLIPLAAILGLIMTAMLYSFRNGISGNDFWWHVKVGQWVVEHGYVPTTDIFSWYGTAQQIPWTAHEWLADVILYGVHHIFGQIGIFVLSISAAMLMLCLLWSVCWKHVEKNIPIGGAFLGMYAVTSAVFFYGRPQLFSFFLLFWELKVLFRFMEDPDSKGIYMLPLLTCLWSNIHGGSASISYVLCVVFLVVGVLKLPIGRIEPTLLPKKAVIKLLVVTLCTIAAILVNPVGLKVLIYPYKSFSDDLQMTLIQEWRAPDAKNIGDLLRFYLPIVLVVLGYFSHEKKIRWIDLAVLGLFLLLFLRSVRFIMMWYIVAAFCGLPYVPEWKVKPMSRKEQAGVIGICSVVFSLLIGYSGICVYKTAREGTLISVAMSDAAVAAVAADAPQRLFNDYNLGETLIYNDLPVFFDARADLYSEAGMMEDGISLMLLDQADAEAETPYVDVEALLRKYEFDAILIPKTRSLNAYIVSHPQRFEMVYEDDEVVYYRICPDDR